MGSPHMGSLTRPIEGAKGGRHLAVWAALALGWILPTSGCQVEYAGMTLPSGKYMHDDAQYFPPGPDFPWANTQAATQRARMQAMGMEVPPEGQRGPFVPPVAAGAVPNVQNKLGEPTDTNASPMTEEAPIPTPPAPGNVDPPAGGAVPPPAP